ncbi:MAG: ParB/RepB/Spo0J family partition protein [Clostridia bacterium]|nr:ParB/RepB/Spo0J family partition protein [Clostridia bacterium]
MISEKPRTAGQVLLIPNDQIYPNPNQPRQVFDQEELVNLAISIRMNGILQPITVRQTDKGYELVSGERRLRASKLAGLISIPCIVVDVNNMKSAVFALIENLQRQNLNYFEEAIAIDRLMSEYGLSQEDAARRLGKAPSTVSNKLRLLSLPEQARNKLMENGLTERHARALLKLEKDEVMGVLEKIIDKKLNVTQSEELIEEVLDKKDSPKRNTKRMFSDVKIFLNTINSAVDTMKKSGIGADIKREDTGESYIYRIEIPKRLMYKLPEKQTALSSVATLHSSDSI